MKKPEKTQFLRLKGSNACKAILQNTNRVKLEGELDRIKKRIMELRFITYSTILLMVIYVLISNKSLRLKMQAIKRPFQKRNGLKENGFIDGNTQEESYGIGTSDPEVLYQYAKLTY